MKPYWQLISFLIVASCYSLSAKANQTKKCGEEIVFPKLYYEFYFSDLVNFVINIEPKLESWKPASLLIVFATESQTQYVKTILHNRIEHQQNISDDDAPYGARINTAEGTEPIFVFPASSGKWSFLKVGQLAYLMSSVNKSRALMTDTSGNLRIVDDFLRSSKDDRSMTRIGKKELFENVTSLRQVGLQQDTDWLLGDCTWGEKLDEISDSIHTEISLRVATFVESIQSYFIRFFIHKLETRTLCLRHIVDWEIQCNVLSSIAKEVSNDNVFDVIRDISTVYKYNPYPKLPKDAKRMQKAFQIAARIVQFRDLVPDRRWITSIRSFQTLCNRTRDIAEFFQRLEFCLGLSTTKAKLPKVWSSNYIENGVLNILQAEGIVSIEPKLKSVLNAHPRFANYVMSLLGLNGYSNDKVYINVMSAV